LRGNTLKRYLVLGHTQAINGSPNGLDAVELKYDVTGENHGIFGSHVEIKACRTFQLLESLEVKHRFKVGAEVLGDMCWKQKVDENFDIHVVDTINLTNLFLNPSK
jgi:hypothetical protein